MALVHNLQTILTLLIVLSILVVAHEWGHFIVARLFGIRVDDFSIGFGKRLVRLGKRGDTEYNLRMLPFGGFVKIAGMAADEEPLVRAKDKALGRDPDPDSHDLPLMAENVDTNTQESAAAAAPDEFGSKALWQRALVILAGPVMSFVLGYVILCLIGVTLGWPSGKLLNRVDQVAPGGEGQRIGLRSGDTITAINGQPITEGKQMVRLIRHSEGKPLTLTIQRARRTLTLTGTPQPALDDDNKPVMDVEVVRPGALAALGVQTGDGLLGVDKTPIRSGPQAQALLQANAGKSVTLIVRRDAQPVPLVGTVPPAIGTQMPTLDAYEAGIFKFDPAIGLERTSLTESIRDGNTAIVNIFLALGDLLHRHELQNNAGGIIMMYQATGLAVQDNALKPSSLFKTVGLMAQLSISLAIFNLLPIPILDGGHLLAFFIEWVRRGKKMTEQQQQVFLATGLAIITILFVLIMTNDILRTVKHQLPQ